MSKTNNISTSCDDKKSAPTYADTLVDTLFDDNDTFIKNMDLSKCAACGKGGDNLKVCTSCEQVKYCNAKCRNTHRSKHKKECKKLAAERKLQNKIWDMNKMVISDDKLFSDPPPKEDCPICMLPIPFAIGLCQVSTTYQPCCGKTLCNGCVMEAEEEIEKGNLKDCCAFCRLPSPLSDKEEMLKRVKKRIAVDDVEAIDWLGAQYYHGIGGFPQDYNMAIKLWNKAADLGSVKTPRTHHSLANLYHCGRGVEKDDDKAIHYYKIAAIGGHEIARYNLGVLEYESGNYELAMKHYIIAARCGFEDSLKAVGDGYKAGHVTKNEYASILRAYRDSQDEMKSERRDRSRDWMKSFDVMRKTNNKE